MTGKISEQLDHIKHLNYLREHEKDEPFPLDGSQWSRLVSMRLHREHYSDCRCQDCDNLLTRLHSLNSPLALQRSGVFRAMHYWFLHGDDLYPGNWRFSDQPTMDQSAIKILKDMGGLTPSLTEAEKLWLAQRTRAWTEEARREAELLAESEFPEDGLKKIGTKESKYWSEAAGEYYESRPTTGGGHVKPGDIQAHG